MSERAHSTVVATAAASVPAFPVYSMSGSLVAPHGTPPPPPPASMSLFAMDDNLNNSKSTDKLPVRTENNNNTGGSIDSAVSSGALPLSAARATNPAPSRLLTDTEQRAFSEFLNQLSSNDFSMLADPSWLNAGTFNQSVDGHNQTTGPPTPSIGSNINPLFTQSLTYPINNNGLVRLEQSTGTAPSPPQVSGGDQGSSWSGFLSDQAHSAPVILSDRVNELTGSQVAMTGSHPQQTNGSIVVPAYGVPEVKTELSDIVGYQRSPQNITTSTANRSGNIIQAFTPIVASQNHSSPSPTPSRSQQRRRSSRPAHADRPPGTAPLGRPRKPPHELLTEAEKKANHIASEQKRRQNIRIGFDQLTAVVPTLSRCSKSEALILQKSVEYIRQLAIERHDLEARMQSLRIQLGDDCGDGSASAVASTAASS